METTRASVDPSAPAAVPAPRRALGPGREPSDAVGRLLAAGARWAQGGSDAAEARGPARRAALLGAQSPVAAVLGCSDSRVPVELVLDQGLGDLFVVGTAGHALDTAVVGSLEYAVEQLAVPLVLVLGHEGCGALAAAGAVLDGAPLPGGSLGSVVGALAPVVAQARSLGSSCPGAVSRHHAATTARALRERSAVVRAAHERGAVDVVAATYDPVSGLVTAVAPRGAAALAAG